MLLLHFLMTGLHLLLLLSVFLPGSIGHLLKRRALLLGMNECLLFYSQLFLIPSALDLQLIILLLQLVIEHFNLRFHLAPLLGCVVDPLLVPLLYQDQLIRNVLDLGFQLNSHLSCHAQLLLQLQHTLPTFF